MLRIYNTLTRSIEKFTPINLLRVGIYSCGPTVYDYAHIGHMRKYTMDDILVRVLRAQGYRTKHVMNITDVGHLVSDEDTGEDKMEKGAKKYGMSVWDIAKKFEEQFFASTVAVGIQNPDELMHATEYIKEQIALIKILEEKGYTYEIPGDGIYYDTSKFPTYFALSRQNPEELQKGARVDFIEGKRNVADFALWKFSISYVQETDEIGQLLGKRQMEWWFNGPFEGKLYSKKDGLSLNRQTEGGLITFSQRFKFLRNIGFPGWHIECSAMSLKALTNFFPELAEGQKPDVSSYSTPGVGKYTIDMHTGGIDHIPVHHSNEIAQSEAATEEKFVNYWVHHNFLVVNNEKMSKSLGNVYSVQDVIEKGYDPRALRYLYLQTHYRQEMNFTWESLDAAAKALERLRSVFSELSSVIARSGTTKQSKSPVIPGSDQESIQIDSRLLASLSRSGRGNDKKNDKWMKQFMDALSDDLNTSKALAVVWEMVKDAGLNESEKKSTLLEMDKILGLDLGFKIQDLRMELPKEVKDLVKEREACRKAGDFVAADEIRQKILDSGFTIEDKPEGPKITKK